MNNKLIRVIPAMLVVGVILGACPTDGGDGGGGDSPFQYPKRYKAVVAWTEAGPNTIKVDAGSINPLPSVNPSFRAADSGSEDRYLPVVYAEHSGEERYYVILLGHIDNVPIFSGTTVLYGGKTTVDISRKQGFKTETAVRDAVETAVTETTNKTSVERKYGEIKAGFTYAGFSADGKLGFENTKTNTNMVERSTKNVHETIDTVTKWSEDEVKATIGNHGEPAGRYRWTLFATTDVYLSVRIKGNDVIDQKQFKQSLVDLNILSYDEAAEVASPAISVCPREDSYTWQIDYDPNTTGSFRRTAGGDTMPLIDDFSTIKEGGEPRFVAAGVNGRMAYSDDGMNWTQGTQTKEDKVNWNAVAFGGNTFIAVSPAVIQIDNKGTGTANGSFTYSSNMAISTDGGVTWTPKTAGLIDTSLPVSSSSNPARIDYLNGIAYGKGTWVAVGKQYRVWKKRTAVTTTTPGPYGSTITSTSYTISNPVTSRGRIIYSTDNGSSWSPVDVGGNVDGNVNIWNDVTYNSTTNMWVAVGASGRIAFTDNLASWSLVTPVPDSAANWNKVTYSNGRFVAVGDNGKIATSVTGAAWGNSVQTVGLTKWNSVNYGNGTLVATGSFGGLGIMAYSTDGKTWIENVLDLVTTNTNWHDVTYGNGVWAAAGGMSISGNMGRMAYSTDGIAWTQSNFGSVGIDYWRAITYGEYLPDFGD